MPKHAALALLLSLILAFPAFAGDKQKVVYHLSDEDKAAFVLGNIRNHIEGMGGPDKVQIVLVMHGPVVKSFVDIDAVDKIRSGVKALEADGVEIDVCSNTLKAYDLTLADMLPGMVEAKSGGVVRIAQLESEGYLYIRP